MPRKARIDAPGALHHVIVRGIERGKIFRSDYDRRNFLNRLGKLIPETQTDCFAWVLIPNHFFFIIKDRFDTGFCINEPAAHRICGVVQQEIPAERSAFSKSL
jgi:REP element-mobilizing transposase RayT